MNSWRACVVLSALLGVVAVFGSPLAGAQGVTGTISGVVLDEQKQAVPGATVTIINESTSDARVTITDRYW